MQIQLKHSGNTGNVPVSLANGELALNYADQLLYYRHANGTIVTIANGAQLGVSTTPQNTFSTISVAGQNNVVADTNTDTLTLVAGESISIVTDQANDSITLSVTNIDGGTF
jgi:hypothetical protein